MKALVPLLTAVALGVSTLISHAQNVPNAPELAQQGTDALVNNQPEEAIDRLELFVKEYQNSPLLYAVYLQLGYAYLMTEQYDKALDSAKKADIPSAAKELQELSAALVPELLAAKAGQTENEEQRKQLRQQAIEAYTKFLQRFPQSPDAESALFGKGIVELQTEKYVDAINTLSIFLQTFQQSPYLLDAMFYGALARLAEANTKVTAGLTVTDGDEIDDLLDQAQEMFTQIAANQNDVALANDAQMQLGDVLAVKARAADGEEREVLLDQAIEAYDDVQATQPLVGRQEDRINAFADQLPAVRDNTRARQQLLKLIAREQQKLEDLKSKTNVILDAKTKIGELLFQTSKYDQARTVFRYLIPLTEKEDTEKTARYHIALTYALQKERPRAVEAYLDFNEQFKGDKDADNLPLVVGSLFLEMEPISPDRALDFFNESLQIYPEGRFASLTTVQKASALKMLGRRDEASKTFSEYLQKAPEGEGAAQAQLGIANIDRDEGRIDKAFERYQQIREKYARSPEAEESSFWIGAILLAQGKFQETLDEFASFRAEYPDSVLTPEVISRMGDAARALGDSERALTLYEELAEKFPETPLAAVSYLKRAAIYQGLEKPDQVDAVLIEFVEKYPQNENVYIAYKTRSDQRVKVGETGEAADLMQEYVERYPDSDRTDVALVDLTRLRKRQMDATGAYITLGQDQREIWEKHNQQAADAAETLVAQFPNSQYAAEALTTLVALQDAKVSAGIQDNEATKAYFIALIDENEDKPVAKNKLTFTLASLLFPIDSGESLDLMDSVYDSSLTYSPENLNLYGTALLEEEKTDQAKGVYEKIGNDYANTTGNPREEPRSIQEAQAIALFGLGKVAEQQGEDQAKQQYFDKVLELYPWSDQAAEAKLYVAEGMIDKGKLPEARDMLSTVLQDRSTPAEFRARAMFLTAEIFKAQNKPADAADTYLKLAVFYPSVPLLPAEGLLKGGEMLENLATRESDPAKNSQLIGRARKAYDDLLNQYPSSPFVNDAKKRLDQLPKPE